jgi:uncharacterized membrane protein YgcG
MLHRSMTLKTVIALLVPSFFLLACDVTGVIGAGIPCVNNDSISDLCAQCFESACVSQLDAETIACPTEDACTTSEACMTDVAALDACARSLCSEACNPFGGTGGSSGTGGTSGTGGSSGTGDSGSSSSGR